VSWTPIPRIGIVLALVLLIGATGTAEFYQVSFKGMDIGADTVQTDESLDIEANLANLAQEPYTDIQVTASLIRETDRTRMTQVTVAEDIDLGPRELHALQTGLSIPSDIPQGNYTILLQAYTPAGIPMTFLSEDITIENPESVTSVSFGNQGVYIVSPTIVVGDNIASRYSLPSFGSQGENVLPDTSFNITFSLTNDGSEPIDPAASARIVPTYTTDDEPIKSLEEDLGDLSPGESREYEMTTSVETAGTYVIEVEVRDGQTSLGENEVRLVISGGGGSIIDMQNAQDTYEQGEQVRVDAQIVGPADGSTVVEDAYLRMEVLKDGQTIDQEEQTIDELPFNPRQTSFNLTADEELDEYTMRLVLGKGDTVFDTYEAQYQPIEVERQLTSSGQVDVSGQCLDDGVCTREEYEIGGCYDCTGVEEPPGEDDEPDEQTSGLPQGPLVIGLILAGIIGGAIIYREVR